MKSYKPHYIVRLQVAGICLSCLSMVGCATVQEITQIQKPKVEVEKVRFTGLSFDAIDLAFDIKIENPNRISATMAGFDYDFQINDASFLQGQRASELTLKALGESTVEIPLTLRFNDLYNTYQSLKDQDSSAYKLECGLDFNLPVLGKTRIPVSTSGYLPLLKLPKVNLSTLHLKKLNFSGADLELELEVENPNAFSLLLNNLDYDLRINEQSWAKGEMKKQLRIGKNEKSSLSFPVSLDFVQMSQSVMGILSGSEALNYQFQGNINLNTSIPLIGKVNLPFDRTGQVNIKR